jgi:hypothetical protein
MKPTHIEQLRLRACHANLVLPFSLPPSSSWAVLPALVVVVVLNFEIIVLAEVAILHVAQACANPVVAPRRSSNNRDVRLQFPEVGSGLAFVRGPASPPAPALLFWRSDISTTTEEPTRYAG